MYLNARVAFLINAFECKSGVSHEVFECKGGVFPEYMNVLELLFELLFERIVEI